jgi:type 1 glutamine amidotransferase
MFRVATARLCFSARRIVPLLLALFSASSMGVAEELKTVEKGSPSQPSAAQTIKALLISGGCCHDYPRQQIIIAKGLAQRAKIQVDVVEEGDGKKDHMVSKYNEENWADGYDVILHNECFGDVKDEAFIRRILKAHLEGKPAVFIHCSMHSYRNSGAIAEGWRELIGVTSKRHESARAENVVNVLPSHPVMQGFPAKWTTPNGELYVIEKVWPNCTPLATAFGPQTKADHPVIWVNTLGKTKVFGTTLGHHNDTMLTEEWLGVVTRGTLWTVGKLQENGQPVAGFEGTGVEPIELPGLKPIPESSLPAAK